MRAIIIATTLLALAGCGTASAPGIPPIDMTRLDQAVNAARSLCRQGQPVLAAASMIPVPQVAIIASAVSALCGPLLAGQVPATVDANTPNWLSQNIGDLVKLLGRTQS